MLDIVILAAGKGTRMRSSSPKVLQTIAGRPMLDHVYTTAKRLLKPDHNPIVVTGFGGEAVQAHLANEKACFVTQAEQLGTGHAVSCALPQLGDSEKTLILYADVPLTRLDTLQRLIDTASAEAMSILTIDLANPTGYGRIMRDPKTGEVVGIVEEKDANSSEKAIREINTGIMVVPTAKLQQWLPQLGNNNAQGEYYLTDIVAMAKSEGVAIETLQPSHQYEVDGVNDRLQQAALEREFQRVTAQHLMQQGLQLLDPERFDCRGELSFGDDVCIDVNVIIEGKVTLEAGVSIGPNCVIKNAHIGANTRIEAFSSLEDCIIESECSVGPYARLRPGSHLLQSAKVGNFVEVKKSVIGVGSKVNHLSYIGDCSMGRDVNVGAGTITCNYDGVNKFKTEIGDGCFIGSNSALVAPVSLAAETSVGAGSTITKNTEPNDLAIARARQRNISGWQKPTKQ